MPLTSPGNDDDTGENHQPTLRKNTAEPAQQTLKQYMFAWANAHLEEGGAGLAMGWDEDAPDAGGVEELRRQVEALWLENAVMGETIRVLKADDPRLDPSMLTNWSRTRIIDAIRGEFGLARALQATGLKRGTYYYERGVIVAGDK